MSLEKNYPTPPTDTQDERIRTTLTKRKGMSGRGNFGANKPGESTIGSGKGAQHHQSNKASKHPTSGS